MRLRAPAAADAALVALVLSAPAGAVDLKPCPGSPTARCGSIVVPAFRSDPSAGTLRIAFRRYPALGRRALRTVLAIEGGPGYPSTGSAGYYLAMLGPRGGRRRSWSSISAARAPRS